MFYNALKLWFISDNTKKKKMIKHFHYDISEISFLQNIHFIISDNSKET